MMAIVNGWEKPTSWPIHASLSGRLPRGPARATWFFSSSNSAAARDLLHLLKRRCLGDCSRAFFFHRVQLYSTLITSLIGFLFLTNPTLEKF